MNIDFMIQFLVNLNLLFVIGLFAAFIALRGARVLGFLVSFRDELNVHYFILWCVLIFSVVSPLLPELHFVDPPVKVWAASSLKEISGTRLVESSIQAWNNENILVPRNETLRSLQWGLISLFAVFLLVSIVLIYRDVLALKGILRGSFPIRRWGALSILVNDSVGIPFSVWTFSGKKIVLPSFLLERPADLKIAIMHEIEHHRRGDTKWVYVFLLLKQMFWFNPAIHLWSHWLTEAQEFACDEALIEQKKIDSKSYARCLIQVAQNVIKDQRGPACATGFLLASDRSLLKRRIEEMISKRKPRKGWLVHAGVTFPAIMLIGVTAFAAKGLMIDRRMTMARAHEMAEHARHGTTFPITVNERILMQLNRYLGTPDGRDFVRQSLERMQLYREQIGGMIHNSHLPEELLAVPFVESGFRNLHEGASHSTVRSAGLWQFIRQTARNFGLRVEPQTDERLDVERSTDAALRYLQANQLRFQDWQLSILAYNMGENALQKGIDRMRSRDAWQLIENGFEGDRDYLAKVMAAVLILKNPDCLD